MLRGFIDLFDLDEIKSSIEWLNNNEPNDDDESFLESLIGHWNDCYQYRCSKTKHDETFIDIVSEFPVLRKSHGFTLVRDLLYMQHHNYSRFKSLFDSIASGFFFRK